MEKLRKFIKTDIFTLVLIILASVVIFTGQEIIGTLVFAIIIGACLAISEDFLPALQSILITFCFAIRCKNSFDDFMKFWYLAPIVAVLVIFHFIKYRHGFSRGSCFWGIVAASAATTLGGLGIITAEEYFSANSIFYTFLLGFGMLVIYMYMAEEFKRSDINTFSTRFSKMMVCVIIMLCICLFEEYLSRRAELADGIGILPFQWRNNSSTMLMIAMPFAFYLSAKKFPYFFVGILSYVAILFAGSRGGMLFGLIELGLCCVVMFIIDKKHRTGISITVIVCLLLASLLKNQIAEILQYTIDRLVDIEESDIRLGLIKRGFEDFKANPVFGRGLGYMGNNDVHNNAKFTLCWYHCSPIQVIGSFGIFGILAYGFLIFTRIKTLFKNPTFFNIMIFVSYIGIEMMSLVNPGVFAPFPYLFLVTLQFIIMEKCNSENDKKELSLMMKTKKKAV